MVWNNGTETSQIDVATADNNLKASRNDVKRVSALFFNVNFYLDAAIQMILHVVKKKIGFNNPSESVFPNLFAKFLLRNFFPQISRLMATVLSAVLLDANRVVGDRPNTSDTILGLTFQFFNERIVKIYI